MAARCAKSRQAPASANPRSKRSGGVSKSKGRARSARPKATASKKCAPADSVSAHAGDSAGPAPGLSAPATVYAGQQSASQIQPGQPAWPGKQGCNWSSNPPQTYGWAPHVPGPAQHYAPVPAHTQQVEEVSLRTTLALNSASVCVHAARLPLGHV